MPLFCQSNSTVLSKNTVLFVSSQNLYVDIKEIDTFNIYFALKYKYILYTSNKTNSRLCASLFELLVLSFAATKAKSTELRVA